MLEITQLKINAGFSVSIGIMGGTFDPIHEGHLAAARAARDAMNLDEVLFIPAGNPAFKQGKQLAGAQDRLAMCALATEGEPAFCVDDCELAREGVTYSVDTLAELQERYGKAARFYFIVGTDSAATLPRWHDAQRLAQLATFVVVLRPGYEQSDDLLDMLADEGFSAMVLQASTPQVSSSEIREAFAAGAQTGQLVPPKVATYIQEHGLYGTDNENNPLSDAFYQARKAELVGRVNEHRFTHIMGVAETAEQLARVYDVDARMARLAGLLHDWDKGYNDEQIRARANELELQLPRLVYENLPRVLHAHTAAAAIARDFPTVPPEVCQAIDRHTVAACDMAPLDMVVYIADAIEPNRTYDDVTFIRDKIGAVPLDELFLCVYEYWLERMLERRMLLHPNTIDVWNHYAALLPKTKGKNK